MVPLSISITRAHPPSCFPSKTFRSLLQSLTILFWPTSSGSTPIMPWPANPGRTSYSCRPIFAMLGDRLNRPDLASSRPRFTIPSRVRFQVPIISLQDRILSRRFAMKLAIDSKPMGHEFGFDRRLWPDHFRVDPLPARAVPSLSSSSSDSSPWPLKLRGPRPKGGRALSCKKIPLKTSS